MDTDPWSRRQGRPLMQEEEWEHPQGQGQGNREEPIVFYALNHREADGTKHTITNMITNVHLTKLGRVEDMGHGILKLEIPNLPINNISKIKNRFQKLSGDPNLFVDYNHRGLEVMKLKDTCIGPDDCSIGLFSSGTGKDDRYSILVKSYSVRAARVFQTSVLKGLMTIRAECKENKEQFEAVCHTLIQGSEFLASGPYKSVMSRSEAHRRAVAIYIFQKCKICVPAEYSPGFVSTGLHEPPSSSQTRRPGGPGRWKSSDQRFSGNYITPPLSDVERQKMDVQKSVLVGGEINHSPLTTDDESNVEHPSMWRRFGFGLGLTGDLGGNLKNKSSNSSGRVPISFSSGEEHRSKYEQALGCYASVETNSELYQDFPIVSLTQKGSSQSILLFNHVYHPLALHEGAPFLGGPGEGYFTYQIDLATLREVSPNLYHKGAPTSVSFVRDEVGLSSLTADEDYEIKAKVKWFSQIDVSYIANPAFFFDLDSETECVENAFSLSQHKCLWRCVYTIFSPPSEKSLTLEEFSNFGCEEVLHIPVELWNSLIARYVYVLKEWEGRIDLNGVSNATIGDYPPSSIRPEDTHPRFSQIIKFSSLPAFSDLFGSQPHVRPVHASYRKRKPAENILQKEGLSSNDVMHKTGGINETHRCDEIDCDRVSRDPEGNMTLIDKGHLSIRHEDLTYILELFHFFYVEKPEPSSLEYRKKEAFVQDKCFSETDYSTAPETERRVRRESIPTRDPRINGHESLAMTIPSKNPQILSPPSVSPPILPVSSSSSSATVNTRKENSPGSFVQQESSGDANLAANDSDGESVEPEEQG